MNSQSLNTVASRVWGRDSWQGLQDVQDGSLFWWLLEVAIIWVHACLLKQSLGLYLLTVWMSWELWVRGSSCWAWTYIVAVCRRLLHHVPLLDIWSCHFDLLLRHVVVVVLLLVLIVLVLWGAWSGTSSMFAARRLVLAWMIWDVLFAVLVSTNRRWILLKFNPWDCGLVLRWVTIRVVAWEVLWPGLVSHVIDLGDFFPCSIWVINVTCHVAVALIVLWLRGCLICSILDYFNSLCFLLWVLWDCNFLFLDYDVALLIRFLPAARLFLALNSTITITLEVTRHESVWELVPGNRHSQ